MVSTLKNLKLWQIGALVLILGLGITIAFALYSLIYDSGQIVLGEDEQLIPIQYGNLLNEVSVNGSLIYPNRKSFTFGTKGIVEDVFVNEGQHVEKGQALARLDSEAVANLEEAVARARVDLQDAEEALNKAIDSYTTLDLAQGEAKVANARVTLQDAKDSLADLVNPPSQKVTQAEITVIDGQLALEKAQEAFDKLLTPTAMEIVQAKSAVTNSELKLKNAQEALNNLLNPTAATMAQSRALVTNSKLALENASTTLLELINSPSDEDISEAQLLIEKLTLNLEQAQARLIDRQEYWDDLLLTQSDAVTAAYVRYQDVFYKWLGAEIVKEESVLDPTSLLKMWGTDLSILFDTKPRFYDMGKAWLAEGSRDDPNTRWNETVVYAWLNFYPGTIKVTCTGVLAEHQTDCISKEFEDSWALLNAAEIQFNGSNTNASLELKDSEEEILARKVDLADSQTALTEIYAGSDILEIDLQYDKLALAQIALTEAQEKLDELLNGPDPLELQTKQEQLELAQANLDDSKSHLSEITGPPDPLQLNKKQTELAMIQVDLELAKTNLEMSSGEPDPLLLEARQKQVDVAKAKLDEAIDQLTELQSVDTLEITVREAKVVSAKAALTATLQRLENSTLKASWDGIVSVVNVEELQEVNPNTPLLEIVDPFTVEMEGIVDEIDIPFVKEGAPARVTMDALPDQMLEGTVSLISSAASNQQGVVSYPIRIRLARQQIRLPEGLSAVASVVIREELNVLLLPLQAIYGTFEKPTVRLMGDDRIEEKAVVLGNTDDFWATVLSGLSEGDQVVMQSQQATTAGFGFSSLGGGFRRSFGQSQSSNPGFGGGSFGGGSGRGQGR